ncbi:MAG: hypothetical protein RJB08_1315 [Actinomycetota bacterium]
MGRHRRTKIAIGTFAFALLMGACGGSTDSAPKTKNAALTTTSAATVEQSTIPAAPTSDVMTTSSTPAATTLTTTPTTVSPTTTNPLDCLITATQVGGSTSANDVRVKITVCQPMTNININYVRNGETITYSRLEGVSNGASTIEVADLATLTRLNWGIVDSIGIQPWLASGYKIPMIVLPISPTTQSKSVRLPAPTTTVPPTVATTSAQRPVSPTPATVPLTCRMKYDGKILSACKPFKEVSYQYFGASGLTTNMKRAGMAWPSTDIDLGSATSKGATKIRVSITLTDGSAVSNVDIAVGTVADIMFSQAPTPTTTTTLPSGCDIQVSRGVIRACAKIASIEYQWWSDAVKVSGNQGATYATSADVVYLGSMNRPPTATRALITLTLTNGRTTKPFFVSLTQPTETFHASFRFDGINSPSA